MASSTFSESVDLLGSIRAILEDYPFSAGLLRELLQNSDDAGATHQTFLLDCRTHPTERLCDPRLAEVQGPSLLAFNNATFVEEDWTALRNISNSSKKEDTSKIGKFGVGIRSCYHITDSLQVLSGDALVIFDPQKVLVKEGGVHLLLQPGKVEEVRDNTLAFRRFLPKGWNGEPFDGTVIRLPLRSEPSEIREKVVSPEEIRQLFKDFIGGELNMAMLFLRHLRFIEFIVIDDSGREQRTASSTIQDTLAIAPEVTQKTVSVDIEGGHPKVESWVVLNQSSDVKVALDLLKSRVGSSCENALKEHKLRPDVGIAYPLPLEGPSDARTDIGQLFTFLRLPIETGFPVHVHACFALTRSRQHLRSRADIGIVKKSGGHIVAEWNKILFEIYIPRAWAQFLELLATHFASVNVFSAWPALQLFSKGGESAYWQSVPSDLFNAVLEARLPVWPAIGQGYFPLEDVFVASDHVDASVLNSLASVGVNICGPVPENIYSMIETHSIGKERILNPSRAADVLRRKFIATLADVDAISSADRGVILSYLLSSGDLTNIIGLPIVPTVSGKFVALFQACVTPQHTLLEAEEVRLFEPCDDNAIRLDDLPQSTKRAFKATGSTTLNVRLLDANRVVEYLALHPTRQALDRKAKASPAAVTFLGEFWSWMHTWKTRSELFPKLGELYLLPCLHGLEKATQQRPVFESKSISMDSLLLQYLTSIGVPFIVDLDTSAHDALTSYGLVKPCDDIHSLLDCINRRRLDITTPSANQVSPLLEHFKKYMMKPFAADYTSAQKSTFQKFPIFPIVEYVKTGSMVSLNRRSGSLEGLSVYGVQCFEVLPKLPNTVFVNTSTLGERLLPLLNPSEPRSMSATAVLSLSMNRLNQQPKALLALILRHIASKRDSVTGTLRKALREERFVLSAAGALEPPGTLIDPLSPIYPLYVGTPERRPRHEDGIDQQIVTSLSILEVFDMRPTASTVMDRIQYISENPHNNVGFEMSIRLMNMLYTEAFDCDDLQLAKTLAWIPTQRGSLSDASGCRPARGQTPSDDETLFDQVLEKVHSRVLTVPMSLAKKLGWDDPIPVSVLTRQFVFVLESDDNVVQRATTLIKELAKRELGEGEKRAVKEALDGKEWVPASGQFSDKLVLAWQAMFNSPFAGVYRVTSTLREDEDCREFMKGFGCQSRPTIDTVTRRLSQLAEAGPSDEATIFAIPALQYAADELGLDDDIRKKLVVPDRNNALRPLKDVVFNDIGHLSTFANLDGQYLAHERVGERLASALRLEHLGLRHIHLKTLDEDMNAPPSTIVENTLRQYKEKQFLPEFLANAEDAGASRFEVILNGHATRPERGFLSPQLARLYDGPSVLVCNDEVFRKEDWSGICRISRGSKRQYKDAIGQFGLGVLTMFHIAECAIIYSGDSVLILDPFKTRFPTNAFDPEPRASMIFPLQNLMQWYPGHTEFLDGLEYFDRDAKRVNGTIFYLPLRQAMHMEQGNAFKEQTYTLDSFEQSILRDFETKAADCLLFIKVGRIETRRRLQLGQPSERLWSFEAVRSHQEHEGFVESGITIESRRGAQTSASQMNWRSVSAHVDAESVPPELRSGDIQKTVRIGLAAPLDDVPGFKSKYFTTLPLAIYAGLPVHVNASFRLASDRRTIRLDSYDTDDTRFNKWLLGQKLPALYLQLLEIQAKHGENARWWPGTSSRTQATANDEEVEEDLGGTSHESSISSILVESFYSKHLPTSTLPIFRSAFTEDTLSFADTVLFPSRMTHPSVLRVYTELKPRSLAKLPSARKYLTMKAGLPEAHQGFLKGILMANGGAERIRTVFRDDELVAVLIYLTSRHDGPTSSPAMLQDVPLLRLEGGSWTTFQTGPAARYYTPSSPRYTQDNFFPPHRFVDHRAFPVTLIDSRAEVSIDVGHLDAAAIKMLSLEELGRLQPGSNQLLEWVRKFWRLVPSFPEHKLLQTIENLLLVPVRSRGVPYALKTLCDVRDGKAMVTTALEADWLKDDLADLGIPVVDMEALPADLKDRLRYGAYSQKLPSFPAFIQSIQPILRSAVQVFQTWPFERRHRFSEWVRTKITSKVAQELLVVAKALPIWLARRGTETTFCAANETYLLPSELTMAMGRFCHSFHSEDVKLKHLGCSRQSYADFMSQFSPPTILAEGEDETIYLDFVRQFGRQVQHLALPNTERRMVQADTLYRHGDFFNAAFGPTSNKFLLPSFDLPLFGWLPLKKQSKVNQELFAQCARVFQNGTGGDDRARARVLYRDYYDHLPLRSTATNQPGRWRMIDGIRFIPRNMADVRNYQSSEVALPQRIRDLPTIVAPNNVVREKYYSIAWTQRAKLAEEPGVHEDRIAMAYPDFGRPTGQEVIAHLKALVRLPPGPVIIHDLRETYKWLNDPVNITADVKRELEALKDEAIFLNIDSSAAAPNQWTWCSASQLAFESHDLANVRAVRPFLAPFHNLLTTTGVLEAFYPDISDLQGPRTVSDEDAFLQQLRTVFNDQRLSGHLTDVVLLPDEDLTDPAQGDGDQTDPQQLRAHRSFLSGCSAVFRAMFMGEFKESQGDATVSHPQIIQLPHSGLAIKAALDYCYTGKAVSEENVALDDLLELLGLANYLDVTGLFVQVQGEIIKRKLVDPHTLATARARAEQLSAETLVLWCDRYAATNEEYINMISQGNP